MRYKNEIDVSSDLFTIEHILPENAQDNWGGFSSEEINRSIYRIGNLTLLEKKLNRQADQFSFDEKVKVYNQSKSKLTQDITLHYETWTEEKIASRQRNLAKSAKSIWRIQEL